MLLPIGIVAQAIGTASYPFFASMIASGKKEQFIATLRSALTNTLYLLIPLTILMILVAEQIVTLLFYGGAFTRTFVIATTPLLRALLIGVPAWGVQQVLVRGFYAHNDTIRPTVVGTLITVLSLPFYYYGTLYADAIGVAGASTLAITFYMITLCFVWRFYYYKEALQGILMTLCYVLLEVSPATLLVYFLSPYLFSFFHTYLLEQYFWSNLIALILYTSLFITVYFITLSITKSPRYVFFYTLFVKKTSV